MTEKSHLKRTSLEHLERFQIPTIIITTMTKQTFKIYLKR